MPLELIVGPILSFALGAKLSIYLTKKIEKDVLLHQEVAIENLLKKFDRHHETTIELFNTRLTSTNSRLNKVEDTIEVIDKQTLQKMVTTLQPVSTALKEIQTFVGLR